MHADKATLTGAREDVARATARLRSLGVKVGHVIGHDAERGNFHLSLRVPLSIDLSTFNRVDTQHGKAYAYGEGNVIVWTSRVPAFMSKRNDIDARIVRFVEARTLLDAVADHIERQDRDGQDWARGYREEDVIGIRFERSEHEDTVRIVDILLVNGRPARGGSVNVDMDDTRLSDVVDFHTAPIGE